MPGSSRYIRSIEINGLLDTFLLSAVSSVLLIRFQLYLTHYPQIGGGRLHVAHVIFGGLLMMAALIISFSLINRAARFFTPLLGGIGFGAFIDELGKFITKDNNYFYRPTAALIYIMFIVIYLATRALLRRRGFSEAEYLANAIDLSKEAAYHDLDTTEKEVALAYLSHVSPTHPLYQPVRKLLAQSQAVAPHRPTVFQRLRRLANEAYRTLGAEPWFPTVLKMFFIGYGIGTVAKIIGAVALLTGLQHSHNLSRLVLSGDDASIVTVARLVASIVAGLLIIVGIFRLSVSRLDAYRWWERALLISIFLTQVLQFADNQFSAIFGLTTDLVILLFLRGLMAQERFKARKPKD